MFCGLRLVIVTSLPSYHIISSKFPVTHTETVLDHANQHRQAADDSNIVGLATIFAVFVLRNQRALAIPFLVTLDGSHDVNLELRIVELSKKERINYEMKQLFWKLHSF
jgi:hypothetical protein